MLSVVEFGLFQQVACVVVGCMVMFGAMVGYKRFSVDGGVATIFAVVGLLMTVFGVGGEVLVKLIFKDL